MLDATHRRLVYGRRIRVLARHLAELLPRDASVLDVGSGDGLLARRVMDRRPDVRVRGVDVLARPTSHIPVELFDGVRLPFEDREFDVVTMVDVLHHASQQQRLLSELVRVSRKLLVIKDHSVRGVFARPTLAFMDWVGNARHGVSLPYSYWTPRQWSEAYGALGLRVVENRDRLGLYPWPASLVFERHLHFIAVLERTRS
ncbi:MAG TPA: class I SAM-dependent methyltransferase [Gemmatimonadaceae bacterium]|nr:class I SAM-dependent methyltransferase [Gemmatimonadaceae bacterium]